jgi:CheY-like chemotaxis protein
MVHKRAGRDKMKSDMAKIILAEDDEDMRRFLVKALEKAGHHVTSFGEGASAFEEIKQTVPPNSIRI